MAENARDLGRKNVLGQSVEMVQSRLGRPAEIKRGVDVPLSVAHDFQQFLPVVHILERQMFHGRAGDDHAVEAAVADLREGLVKTLQMAQGRILGFVRRRTQQGDVDLNGRIAQQAQQLRFRGDFGGHQVDDDDLQRPDVLLAGAVLGHNKDVFVFQGGAGREISGNLDGHVHNPLQDLAQRQSVLIFKAMTAVHHAVLKT